MWSGGQSDETPPTSPLVTLVMILILLAAALAVSV